MRGDDRSLCSTCDGWYTLDSAWMHLHAEPQSGPIRDAWLASRLSWDKFMARCERAFAYYRERVPPPPPEDPPPEPQAKPVKP